MADKVTKRGISIFIDGKEVNNSVKAIRAELQLLRNEQAKAIVGSENYVKSGKKIAELNTILERHTQEQKKLNGELLKQEGLVKKNGGAFSRMADGLNKYGMLVGSFIASITGVSMAFRKLSNDIAHMDDVYSDVMKTTGATHRQVEELNESFKKLDTRTSREQLNKEAEELGRLGVEMRDIPKATAAVDKAVVSLGDSFAGGAEEIVTSLGKMNGLYKQTKSMEIDKSFISIGSSLNELAAKGASTEQNISAFTIRVGSMQEALKPAIADAMGLGAAFEESGIEAEIASRAYSIVLNRASTNTADFASVMGKTTKEVEQMINANPLEFFLEFAEAMKGMSAVDTAKTLDELKINAEGANKILGAAGNNIDRFRELIDISNNSLKEGVSLQNEFAIKNTNLQAQLEKKKKAFSETALELGQNLYPALLMSTDGITYLIKALVVLPKWLAENIGLIVSLSVSIGAYTIAVNAAKIALIAEMAVQRTKIVLEKTATAATLAYAAAKALLTGNIGRATAAMRVLQNTIKINPYLLVAGAIAGIVTTIYKLATATTVSKKAMGEFSVEMSKSSNESNTLFNALKNVNLKAEQRSKIIKAINERYGDYLPNLLNEKSSLIDIEKAQEAVNKALSKKIALQIRDKAMGEVADDYTKKILKTANNLQEAINEKAGEQNGAMIFSEVQNLFAKNGDNFAKGREEAQKYLNAVKVRSWDAAEALIKYTNTLQQVAQKQSVIKDAFKGLVGDELEGITGNTSGVVVEEDDENNNKKGNVGDDSGQSSKKENRYKEALDAELQAYIKYLNHIRELRNRQVIDDNKFNELQKEATIDNLDETVRLAKHFYGEDSKEYQEALGRRLDAENDFAGFIEESKKRANSDAIRSIEQQTKAEIKLIESQKQGEMDTVESNYKRGKISYSEYEASRFEISNKYNGLILAAYRLMQEALEKLQERGVDVGAEKLEEVREHITSLLRQMGIDADDFFQNQKSSTEQFIDDLKNIDYGVIGNGFRDAFVVALEELEELKGNSLAGLEEWSESVLSIMGGAFNAIAGVVVQAQEYETAALEAEKAEQLSIAGDSKSGREAIEKDFAKKEHELRKKQAKANGTIQIAQGIAAGALAVVQSFAQLGPIAGAIAAAVVAVTTGLQIATIVKQQQAIEASAPQFYTGGFTKEVGKYQPAGVVHGGEYVVPMDGVRNKEILPFINVIEKARQTGRLRNIGKEELKEAFGGNQAVHYRGGHVVGNRADNNRDIEKMLLVISHNAEVMQELKERLDKGIEAYSVISGDNGIYSKSKEYEMIKNNSRL